MSKILGYIAGAALTLALSASQPIAETGTARLGAYDPHGSLKDDRDVSIDHLFVYWQAFDPEWLRAATASTAQRGRQLMVTLEPWTRAENWKDGRETLLAKTASGEFDREIASVCRIVGGSGAEVMINWGHEMDETEGRFPWANQNHQAYIEAFRHVVERCRAEAPRARFGWTPKGEPGFGSYYPGAAYVDFIGLTLFDVQGWNRDHDDRRTFEDKFGAHHGQVAGYGKPIVLAEFGVEGDADYRQNRLSCVRERIRRFRGVEALVYFNDRETWRWPPPYGQPDWRVHTSEFFRCDRREAALSSRGAVAP